MSEYPNYQEMYLLLFRAVTRAVEELQEAQQACEEIFMESGDEAETQEESQ